MEEQSSPLRITKQESLASENFRKHLVHVVAKNVPFVIQVVCPVADFNQNAVTASLYYDFEEEEEPREVEKLKQQPLEYRTTILNPEGTEASLEIRIFVLSSQHENASFRIKLSTVEPQTQTLLNCWSERIRVVSKRKQAERIINKSAATAAKLEGSSTSPLLSSILPAVTTPSKRMSTEQASNHDLLLTLARLEEEQRESLALLQRLQEQRPPTESPSQDVLDQLTIKGAESVASSALLLSGQSENDFEQAFKNFLDCWRNIPEKDRAEKMHRMLGCLSDPLCLIEFIEHYTKSNYFRAAKKPKIEGH